jgi:hypothetical protein
MASTYLEPLCPAAPLSGDDVIEDACNALALALRGRAGLLPTDSYSSYSATVIVTFQLHDIDTTKVEQTVAIGALDPAKATGRITVNIPVSGASEARERSDLPEPSYEESAAPTKRRWYCPRKK